MSFFDRRRFLKTTAISSAFLATNKLNAEITTSQSKGKYMGDFIAPRLDKIKIALDQVELVNNELVYKHTNQPVSGMVTVSAEDGEISYSQNNLKHLLLIELEQPKKDNKEALRMPQWRHQDDSLYPYEVYNRKHNGEKVNITQFRTKTEAEVFIQGFMCAKNRGA